MLTIQDWRNGRRWLGTAVIVLGLLFTVVAVNQADFAGSNTVAASEALNHSQIAAPNDLQGIVSADWTHTCGLKMDGSVDCWGGGISGQDEDQTGPFVQVSTGEWHSCGLRPDGSVDCWGEEEQGQAVDQPGPFTQISAGDQHTCGLNPDGEAECWGWNVVGQADNRTGPFTAVTGGRYHTCGLKPDGSVECWGADESYSKDQDGPFLKVSAGGLHTCGLKPDGDIVCWGYDDFGQAQDQTGPFVEISAGSYHSCARRLNGSVECWGRNDDGQSENQTGHFLQISVGAWHTCGLKRDGSIFCWGNNLWDQAESQVGPFGPTINQGGRLDYTIQQFSDGTWYTGIYLADMDDDGIPEVLAGNRNTSSVEIWRYDSDLDTLVQIDSIKFPQHIHDLKAADFDDDGDMDLAVGLRFAGLYFATNTGSPGTVGSWSIREIDGQYSLQVLVEDFDGDGKLDIFHGVDYGPINTWYGDGSANFVKGASVEDPATDMRFPRGFDAADLNGDKWLDLIGVDGAYMRAFLNPGDRSSGWTSAGSSMPVGDYPCCDSNWLLADVSPSAGDLDGNGVVDQVAFLGAPESEGPLDVLIFEGKTVGSTLKWTQSALDTLAKPGWAGHAGIADLDGDGQLDVHLGGSGNFYGLRVYLGDGRGNYTPEIVVLDHGVGGTNSFATGDLNGDRIVDIVTTRNTDEGGEYSGFEVLFGVRKRWSFLLPALLGS